MQTIIAIGEECENYPLLELGGVSRLVLTITAIIR